MVKTLKVLDIDLDSFLNKKHSSFSDPKGRLDNSIYKPWTKLKVIAFLENQCGLNKENKIPGRYFIHHDELFLFMKGLQERENFNLVFSIDHVDAHADLGFGDSSYVYIATNILFKTLFDRSRVDKTKGLDSLSKGNFLLYAIACRWVSDLKYVNKIEWSNDLNPFIFHNYDIASNLIELKKFAPETMESILNYANFIEKAKMTPSIELEPAVPFQIIEQSKFVSDSIYDYVFLTQSPNYTPETADKLIPLIKGYIDIQNTT